MNRFPINRRAQIILAVAAAFAAAVLGLAVKVGNDMAGYMETSVGLTGEGVVSDAANPFVAAQASATPQPAAVAATAPARDTGANEDQADLRSTGVSVASVH